MPASARTCLRHAGFREDLLDQGDGGAVGMVRVTASLEQAGVSALEAEGENVESDIGPGLINDANDAERNGDLPESQTVGESTVRQRPVQRTGQGGHLTHIGGDAFQALLRQHQAVVKGIVLGHGRQVFRIGLQQRTRLLYEPVGEFQEEPVTGGVIQRRNGQRGVPGGFE